MKRLTKKQLEAVRQVVRANAKQYEDETGVGPCGGTGLRVGRKRSMLTRAGLRVGRKRSMLTRAGHNLRRKRRTVLE